jgi:hypothetical protein
MPISQELRQKALKKRIESQNIGRVKMVRICDRCKQQFCGYRGDFILDSLQVTKRNTGYELDLCHDCNTLLQGIIFMNLPAPTTKPEVKQEPAPIPKKKYVLSGKYAKKQSKDNTFIINSDTPKKENKVDAALKKSIDEHISFGVAFQKLYGYPPCNLQRKQAKEKGYEPKYERKSKLNPKVMEAIPPIYKCVMCKQKQVKNKDDMCDFCEDKFRKVK